MEINYWNYGGKKYNREHTVKTNGSKQKPVLSPWGEGKWHPECQRAICMKEHRLYCKRNGLKACGNRESKRDGDIWTYLVGNLLILQSSFTYMGKKACWKNKLKEEEETLSQSIVSFLGHMQLRHLLEQVGDRSRMVAFVGHRVKVDVRKLCLLEL